MHPQVALLRDLAGAGMNGAGIAVEDDIGDVVGIEQRRQGGGPVLGPAAKRDVACPVRPEDAIAGVESHAPGPRPGAPQHGGKLVKERAVRALQEQESPPAGGFPWRGGIRTRCVAIVPHAA
jgi:hypothetical protein